MADPIRVLHVDADEAFAESVAAFLDADDGARIGTTPQFEVVTAGSASEGIDRLAGEPIDCVVSEYELPGIDGVEFLETVRADYPALPFVLLTGAGSEDVASEAISAGVTEYLQKSGSAAADGFTDATADTATDATADAATDATADLAAELAGRIASAVEVAGDERVRGESGREPHDTSGLLENVVEQVPIHLYVKDEHARHLWVSGYYVNETEDIPDAHEHVGKTDLELYPEEFSRATYEDDLSVIETGEPVVDAEEYEPAAGEWNLTTKVPWHDEDGEVLGLIGVTRRITKRKEYEQQLQRQNERLEEFASIVSHDLRNPLTVAVGNLELARAERDTERLEVAAGALDRMEALIDDLLALAREGEAAVEVEPVVVADVVQSSWQNVETGDASQITETTRTIWADRSHLQQLFENLFRNAVEHGSTGPASQAQPDAARASSGEPSIADARQGAAEHDGGSVTVRVGELEGGFFVEDDGPGIPEDERERIFQSGYSNSESGTGFGLSIAKQTADVHGWEIRVTEGRDGGARFEVTGVETS